VLVLELNQARCIRVGRLGTFPFPAGWYCYVGSAFGPGGVAARCGHHRRVSARPRWHIDYLRAQCRLREIWYSHDPQSREHQWAELLGRAREARQPVPGFGASDCRCRSHLWYFNQRPGWSAFARRNRMKLPGRPTLKREIVSYEPVWHV
jgi:Uri superfamily endonuclease